MSNQVVWVDMPVLDLDRATAFYSGLLGDEVSKQAFDQFEFALLPNADSAVSGCLVPSSQEDIIKSGPLIYFNANGRLSEAEQFAANNGGKVLEGKHNIGPHGFRAIIEDSEGNKIAIHSLGDD